MTDYEKLRDIIDDIDNLISHHVRASTPAFEAWHTKAERFLIKQYGENSLEHKKFLNTNFAPSLLDLYVSGENLQESIRLCCDGLRMCKAIFETYLDDIANENDAYTQRLPNEKLCKTNKIFIVHGHNGELKEAVARIIEKLGLEAVILSEQVNKGRTIIEKFEDYSDVAGAICLLTADDYGRAKNDTVDKTRARQNVILEAGYFLGKLGRDHVVILADNGIEMPSDLSGLVYISAEKWEFGLAKDLKAMGYEVDLNKL